MKQDQVLKRACQLAQMNYECAQLNLQRAQDALIAIKVAIEVIETGHSSRGGWHHTEEAKERLRKAQIGRPMSQTTKEKIRASLTGRRMTAESKEKIRQAMLARRSNDGDTDPERDE